MGLRGLGALASGPLQGHLPSGENLPETSGVLKKMPVHERYPSYLSDQRRFFDEKVTEDWETYKSSDWDYTRLFEIQQLFYRVRPARILDVGCGCGFHDVAMAKYPFVESVHAIDYSEQSILKANATYPDPKVQRTAKDFYTFSPERQYDLVASFEVFEHFNKPDGFMNSCARSCAAGGVVAICTPNRLRLDNRIRMLSGQQPSLIAVMHYREYTPQEVFQIGKQFGLEPLGYFGYGIHPFVLFGRRFLDGLSIQQRTWGGYYLRNIASVVCVLMRKV